MPRRHFLGLTRLRSPIALVVTLALVPLAWGFRHWETESTHARWVKHWGFVIHDRGSVDGTGGCTAGATERFAAAVPIMLSTTPIGREGAIAWVVRWCTTPDSVSRVHYGFRVVGKSDAQGQPVPGSPPGVVVTKQPPSITARRARYRWIIARHGCRSCTISIAIDVSPTGVAVRGRHVASASL